MRAEKTEYKVACAFFFEAKLSCTVFDSFHSVCQDPKRTSAKFVFLGMTNILCTNHLVFNQKKKFCSCVAVEYTKQLCRFPKLRVNNKRKCLLRIVWYQCGGTFAARGFVGKYREVRCLNWIHCDSQNWEADTCAFYIVCSREVDARTKAMLSPGVDTGLRAHRVRKLLQAAPSWHVPAWPACREIPCVVHFSHGCVSLSHVFFSIWKFILLRWHPTLLKTCTRGTSWGLPVLTPLLGCAQVCS